MKKIVTIKKVDIQKGIRSDCRFCPIGLGIKRRFPNARTISVITDSFSMVLNRVDCDYDLPQRAINFIKRFDAGKAVKPFQFRISV